MPEGGGTTLGQARGVVTIEAQLAQAQQQIAQFSQQTEQQFGRVSSSSKAAEISLKQLAGALGFSFGIAGAVLLGKKMLEMGIDSVKAASDLTESINKIDVAFGGSSKTVLDWSKNSATALGQSQQQALEAASSFGLLFSTIGLGENESAKMSKALVQLATDIASINNISPEEALTKLRSGLVGETEPLRAVGVLLDEATVKAKGLAMGLAPSAEALTQQDKVLARYQLILEQTTKTQGDFARTSGGLANQTRILTAHLGDLAASFGDGLTPAVLTTVQAINDLLGVMEQLKQNGPLVELPSWMTADPLGDFLRNNHFTGDITGGNSPFPFFAPNGLGPQAQSPSGGHVSTRAGATTANPNQTDIDAAVLDRFTKIQEIESQALQARLSENTSYLNQRARSEEQYEENVTRSAADFAKNRMREQEDYEASILDIMRSAHQRDERMAADHDRQMARMQSDSSKRLADLQENLDRTVGQRRIDSAEKIADLTVDHDQDIAAKRADSVQKLLDIDKDYNRQKEDAARDQSITLEEAAANLDARSLFFAARRFRLEQEKRDEAHNEAVAKERAKLEESVTNSNDAYEKKLSDENEALQKSINQANEAYQRQVKDENEALQQRTDDANEAYAQQLADAKAADEQRITDMAAHFKQQKEREDADQVERMGRMAADHTAELTQLDTEHADRLAQISTHAQAERDKLDSEFATRMAALGINIAAENKLHDSMVEAAEKSFDALMLHIENQLKHLPDLPSDQLSPDQQELAGLYGQRESKHAELNLIPRFSSQWFILAGQLDKIDERINQLEQKGVLLPGSTPSQVAASMATITSPVTALPAAATTAIQSAGNLTVTFAQGAVQIYGAVGQPVAELQDAIGAEILRAVRQAAGRV